MRPLKSSERRLLAGLGAALVAAACLVGFGSLLRERARLRHQLGMLETEARAQALLLADRELWTARDSWLTAHQPPLADPGLAQGELLATVQGAAKDRLLTLAEQHLLEPERTPYAWRIPVRVRVIGPLRTVIEWAAEFRAPGDFRTVEVFALGPEKTAPDEEPQVTCTLQIARLHRPPEPPAPAP